jgi:hypothetical protein
MKKVVIMSIITSVIFSCSSNDKKSTTNDSKNNNEVGVPNVNGNIPDTTNAINLSTHKKDSSATKDSAR